MAERKIVHTKTTAGTHKGYVKAHVPPKNGQFRSAFSPTVVFLKRDAASGSLRRSSNEKVAAPIVVPMEQPLTGPNPKNVALANRYASNKPTEISIRIAENIREARRKERDEAAQD